MTDTGITSFQAINLYDIDKRIDLALSRLRVHYDTEPTNDSFDSFVIDLYSCFPQSIPYDIFYASTLSSIGQKMTREVIKQLTWRLAGNIHKLKEGIVVSPWQQQTELEWCPILIVKGKPGVGYDEKPGHYFEYRVLAGSPAGLKFTTFWSLKYSKFVSNSVGYSRSRKINYKLTSGLDMVQMQLYLLFDPELSKDNLPRAYHFHVPESCRKHNLEIIKQRFRVIPCPLNYSLSEMKCSDCVLGYDKCNAGCHPVSYIAKGCPRCCTESWFDPLSNSSICIDCEERRNK